MAVKWHHKEHKFKSHTGKVYHELSEKVEFNIFFSFMTGVLGLILILFSLPAIFMPMPIAFDSFDRIRAYDPILVLTGSTIEQPTGFMSDFVDVRNESGAFVLAGFGFLFIAYLNIKRLERLLHVPFFSLIRLDTGYMLNVSRFKEDYLTVISTLVGASIMALTFVLNTFVFSGFSALSLTVNFGLILCIVGFLFMFYKLKVEIFDPESVWGKRFVEKRKNKRGM